MASTIIPNVGTNEQDQFRQNAAIQALHRKLSALVPSSTTDNAAARYDGTTGDMQNSAFIIDDTGHVSSFGGNIKFPGTQVTSSDANTLDDYEEGTWTAGITFSTVGDLSVSYASRSAAYQKIGKWVHAWFTLTTSSFTHTTASGQFLITGLPFSATDDFVGTLLFSGITKANYTQFMLATASGLTDMAIEASGQGQTISNVQVANVPTGGTVILRGNVRYISENG